MNIKKILVILLAFLILAGVSYAQDYSLYSGKFYEPDDSKTKIEFEFYNGTYSICENEKKHIPILFVNSADTNDQYSLSAFGAGWTSLNAAEFSLPKKQDGVVFLELSPLQNTKGRYSIGINALSSNNVRESLLLNVDVEKCHSLRLEIPDSDKICGGAKKIYSGEIINDGIQKIDIDLNLNAPNWVSLDETSFSIGPGNKEMFELSADIPPNANGMFNAFLSASMRNFPSLKSEKKLSIEAVPKYNCYKADIIAGQKIDAGYSSAYVPIRIRNSGIKHAQYEISLEAPPWISAEPKKLSMNQGQLGNVNLNISPGSEIAEGVYQVKIYAKFEDMAYSKNIELELSKNRFLKGMKSFFVFYQYYIYVVLFIAIVIFIFRKQIFNKIKTSYRNYKIRQARLKALEAARKARQVKRQARQLEKAKFEVKAAKKHEYKRFILFLIGLLALILILAFLVYTFNFPVSKEFVKANYSYLITGILIALFIVFVIEFYYPLYKLLESIDRPKKKR